MYLLTPILPYLDSSEAVCVTYGKNVKNDIFDAYISYLRMSGFPQPQQKFPCNLKITILQSLSFLIP